jgi:hypothetical protein
VGSETDRIQFTARIDEHGRVHPEDAAVFRDRLHPWRGQRVFGTLERYRKPKTNPQLALYFDVLLPAFAEHCGYDEKDMHQELKLAWMPLHATVSRLTGEERMEIPSLADASVDEMSQFIERLYREGDSMGLRFPARKVSA